MKPIQLKFDGAKAIITTNIWAGGQWWKKSLSVYSGEDLWEGLERLRRIDLLPEEDKILAAEHISKSKEREELELALPRWLSAGNKIKIIPAVDRKLDLSEEEKAAVLEDLGLDLDLPAGSNLPENSNLPASAENPLLGGNRNLEEYNLPTEKEEKVA